MLRVGSTYYAYGTNTGGKLLPAMTSTDLGTWTARRSSTGRWWENDALAQAPRWAKRHWAHGKWRVATWAPSVARVEGGYVAAYAAPAETSGACTWRRSPCWRTAGWRSRTGAEPPGGSGQAAGRTAGP